MSTVRNQAVIPADTSKLFQFREYLYQLCAENNVPSQTARRMVLAIDEALSNVIEHGKLGKESDIEVHLEFEEGRIVASVRDRGVPFDPTPYNGTPDHRTFPRRGFGLYLIHLIVDSMHYERTGTGENVLTLTKAFD